MAAGSFADIRKNVTYLKNQDYAQLIRTADLKSNFSNGDFVYVDKHAFEYLWRVNLDEPCIILPNIGNIGEVYYVNPNELPYNNNVLAPNAILLKSNNTIKFKYYLLESPYFKNQLDIINEAGGRGKFNKTNLKKIKIKVPNNNLEKEKIGNCLSSVDNKIELLEAKHKSYIGFKKYLMQQIFTQKLRFDKECIWEEYQLYDIGETYNGLSGLSKDNFEKGDSQFITYKSIFDNNILSSNFTDNVELNDKSQNIVKKGDLFFTGSSETPEEVGMVSVLNCNIENCYLNSFCFGYRLNDNANINPIFLAYYLRSPVMRNKIMVLAQGSTRFNLSKKEILKLKINIPPITEQQKIKDLFQYLDKNINIISNQVHCINEFKKGLLQQMFV